jgi:hypothetical protein
MTNHASGSVYVPGEEAELSSSDDDADDRVNSPPKRRIQQTKKPCNNNSVPKKKGWKPIGTLEKTFQGTYKGTIPT